MVWQTTDLAGDRPFAGAFWGMLVGLLILLPIVDRTATRPFGSDAIGAAGAGCSLLRLGLDDDFVTSVRTNIGPGCSALFLFDLSPDPSSLSKNMPPLAREVARQAITAEHMARLHAGFDD